MRRENSEELEPKEEPERVRLLGEVASLLMGDRTKDYGDPIDSHERIAAIWRVLFPERTWSAYDISIAMVGMKLARLAQGHHFDSIRDIIGYAAISEEIFKTMTD